MHPEFSCVASGLCGWYAKVMLQKKLGTRIADLRQGVVTAKLSEISYRPAEGFEEDNTWHVSDEILLAESDTKLANGPATIKHGGMEFPVTVTVLEFKPDEDDEGGEDGEPACTIEIGYAEGLPKLALALGLLPPKQPPRR